MTAELRTVFSAVVLPYAPYLMVTVLAHEAGADPRTLLLLGIAWVVSRVAYVGAYVAGAGRIPARFAVAVAA